jgi:hypothetical protein
MEKNGVPIIAVDPVDPVEVVPDLAAGYVTLPPPSDSFAGTTINSNEARGRAAGWLPSPSLARQRPLPAASRPDRGSGRAHSN